MSGSITLPDLTRRLDDAVSQKRAFELAPGDIGPRFAELWDHIDGGERVSLSAPRKLRADASGLQIGGSLKRTGQAPCPAVLTFTFSARAKDVRLEFDFKGARYVDPDHSWDLARIRKALPKSRCGVTVHASVGKEATSRPHLDVPFLKGSIRLLVSPPSPDGGQVWLGLAADSPPLALGSLAELGSLPGLAGTVLDLPRELPAVTGLGLRGLDLVVDPSRGRLRGASARIRLLDTWKIPHADLPLALRDVHVEVSALRAGGPKPAVVAQLSAVLELGRARLRASVSLPDLWFEVDGRLPAGLGLPDVLPERCGREFAELKLPAPPSGGTGAEVRLSGCLRTKAWAVRASVEGAWALGPLTLQGVSLESSAVGKRPAKLGVRASLVIAGAECALSAHRDGSWMVTGAIAQLSMRQVTDWLRKTFTVEVPHLPDVTVQALGLTYDVASSQFTLVCDTALILNGHRMSFHFAVDVGGPAPAGIRAAIALTGDDEGIFPMLFAGEWTSTGKNASTFTLSWKSNSSVPFAALAAALGVPVPDGIPATVRPSLASAGLAHTSGAGGTATVAIARGIINGKEFSVALAVV
ncbi:hypothetical protein [Streptomyces sp. NPDC048340]|uniref:hypothetical protein n=1 Tax=Streptomyces sp. NPDC048340 TaxID=3365537 RepID=UPI00371DAF7B